MKPARIYPFFQVLTQRQDADNIRFLLDTWKHEYFPKKRINEVITDDGAALPLANVKAFAKCDSVIEYDGLCYEAIFNHKPPPAIYMRLDRAHIIKVILRLLARLDKNKKRFYSRIFGLLILCED